MQFKSRQATLRAAIEDWQGRGLIDQTVAAVLSDDLGPDRAGAGFRGFIILAGIISLCFGVMTFVAANWEDFPRLARLAMVVGTIWAAWLGAIRSHATGHDWLAQSLVLLASGLFGAGIMLVSQLYHIQGEPRDAVFLWMLGTAAAALLARSVPALVLAVCLLGLWGVTTDGLDLQHGGVNWSFLVYWAVAAGAAWWLHSRFSAHLVVLVFLIWLIFTLIAVDQPELAVLACYLAGWVIISALLLSAGSARILRGFEGPALVYVLLFISVLTLIYYFLLGDPADHARMMEALGEHPAAFYGALAVAPGVMGLIAFVGRKSGFAYDLWVALGFALAWSVVIWVVPSTLGASALMLAGSIWVVRMGWRASELALRVIGFGGFAGAMLLIYAETIGTLIGTSLFYVGAGVILLLGAWIGSRLKPSSAAPQEGSQ